MKGRKLTNLVGAAALTIIFGMACVRVFFHASSETFDGTTTIRFAHHMLDDSVRAGFDAVAREFERREAAQGRKVRVKRVDVPSNAFRQWLHTQLIGGTAPELIQVNTNGFEDEMLSRYFVSLTSAIEEVNPYNAGTSQEGKKWRDTIIDGMHVAGFNFRILDYFGVPTCARTTRVFMNRDMLESILEEPDNAALKTELGTDLVPRTFEAFMDLCRATRAYAKRHHREISPVVETSEGGYRPLMDLLMVSQTEKLPLTDWDIGRERRILAAPLLMNFATGRHTISDPTFRSIFKLMREVGQYMPPWFFQLQSQDVVFLYAQERALMFVGRSTDEELLRSMSGGRFRQVVFRVPTPSSRTPGYGEFTLGPVFEAQYTLTDCFGLVNIASPSKQKLALEFLQFLTSVPGNTIFTRVSGRLPSVIDVPVQPAQEPMVPSLEGYQSGVSPYEDMPELRRIFTGNYHVLFDPNGSVDAFLENVAPPYREAATTELRRYIRNTRINASRQDSIIAAQRWLTTHSGESQEESEVEQRRLGMMIDGQGLTEDEWLFNRDMLAPIKDDLGL